jgi:hypothetical protein
MSDYGGAFAVAIIFLGFLFLLIIGPFIDAMSNKRNRKKQYRKKIRLQKSCQHPKTKIIESVFRVDEIGEFGETKITFNKETKIECKICGKELTKHLTSI